MGLTHVGSLVAVLHDGPVDSGDQPCAQDAADEKPGEAGAQAQQHVVEEQKVVEVVEHFPANGRKQAEGWHPFSVRSWPGRRAQRPQTIGQILHFLAASCVTLCCTCERTVPTAQRWCEDWLSCNMEGSEHRTG